MLQQLPPEILFEVTSYLCCQELASLRLTSRLLRTYCDHPNNWKNIQLHTNSSGQLWKLDQLKKVIGPHLAHIQSIRIWGVRDNIVHYILSSCYNLRHLTICGWTTLSDHSLRLLPPRSLKVKTLALIGSCEHTKFASIDASTLSNLLAQCPEMTHLVLGCELQMNAETLVAELEKKVQQTHLLRSDLQSFTLATKRTWLNEHVLRLIKIYPSIQSIYLLPDATIGFCAEQETLDYWMTNKLDQIIKAESATPMPIKDSEISLISNHHCIVYDKSWS
ncbi:uncharacterized protein B0P05DRAFT_522293 [Gilbertella persicaria]|uniref:uncharacterized protein n=1 Tax=Gilbertella persicaria TaxID=101096 RepID=UPI002220C2F6|nr:uncharacterized protein B0P05DRAFT_522293 [Gilbertella persicaria]KAI8097847.1 hypothetical protein B0P05DRAFT_522293 [Gilbertella persicaria]